MDGIARALDRHPVLIDLKPDRIRGVLETLGRPQDKTPPVIHISGTNGKGSTLAFLQAMFEAAGKKVHKFTGPHLIHPRERIVVSGHEIGDDYFLDLIGRIGSLDSLSRFETMTAAAFMAFAENEADVVLLETGLGGAGDATNVVESPAVTLISRISLDHQRLLGNTLPEIARQKAGIMRRNVSCVVGAQFSGVTEKAIEDCGFDAGAVLRRFGHEWRVEKDQEAALIYRGGALSGTYPPPALLGEHQYFNAGLAMAALENMPRSGVSKEAVAEGLARTFWPARFQRLTRGPLASDLPQGWELWLDGAHNDSGAEALARQIALWREEGAVHLVLGMKKKKKPADFARALAKLCTSLQTVMVPENKSCFGAAELAAHIPGAVSAGNCLHAVQQARAFPFSGKARIVIAGSLHLAGHVLQDHE